MCQPVAGPVSDLLTITWLGRVGQRPVITRCAQKSVRHTSKNVWAGA